MYADPFYRRFFPRDEDAWVSFHRALESLLPRRGRILDLGCGDNTELAGYRTAQREIWGADFQAHPQLQHAGWFRLLGANGQIPFPTASFDFVASLWVLEHVRSPNAFLAEVARVLRPGGAFSSLTVNGAHYVPWLTRLIHLLPHRLTQGLVHRLYGRAHHDTFRTYYRLNTEPQVRKAARAAGLQVDGIARFANPDYFAFWKPLRSTAIVADWALETLCPGRGRVYCIISLRKPAAAEVQRQAA
jgi:SAM-dependent methyltransferase